MNLNIKNTFNLKKKEETNRILKNHMISIHIFLFELDYKERVVGKSVGKSVNSCHLWESYLGMVNSFLYNHKYFH